VSTLLWNFNRRHKNDNYDYRCGLNAASFVPSAVGIRVVSPSPLVLRQSVPFLNWWPTVEITYLDDEGHSRCLAIGFTGPLPQIGAGQQRKCDAFILALKETLSISSPARTNLSASSTDG